MGPTDRPIRSIQRFLPSSLFRLGSGAYGTIHGNATSEAGEHQPRRLSKTTKTKPGNLRTRTSVEAVTPKHWTIKDLAMGSPLMLIGIVCLMMPAGAPNLVGGNVNLGNNRDFNNRVPPGWSPEQEGTYSFRAYLTDITIWMMMTDLQPHQQCASIIARLGGAAREVARMINPQQMMHGGMLNGVMVDPVTFILGILHARYSALEEESRLTAMTEMLAFQRRQGENINSLLARYDTVRQRANTEGQFVMSVEGCSLQLLRAVGIGTQHMMTLLQPFRGQLPQTELQFQELTTQLRRYGHISEGTPGNIASTLQGPFRQARPGAYLETGGKGAASSSTSPQAFFGNSPGQGTWDALLPQDAIPPQQGDPFAAWAGGGGDTEAGQQQQQWDGQQSYPTWGYE